MVHSAETVKMDRVTKWPKETQINCKLSMVFHQWDRSSAHLLLSCGRILPSDSITRREAKHLADLWHFAAPGRKGQHSGSCTKYSCILLRSGGAAASTMWSWNPQVQTQEGATSLYLWFTRNVLFQLAFFFHWGCLNMFEWNLGTAQNPTLLGSRSAGLHRHQMGHPQMPPVWLPWSRRRAAHTSWTLQHWTILLKHKWVWKTLTGNKISRM